MTLRHVGSPSLHDCPILVAGDNSAPEKTSVEKSHPCLEYHRKCIQVSKTKRAEEGINDRKKPTLLHLNQEKPVPPRTFWRTVRLPWERFHLQQ